MASQTAVAYNQRCAGQTVSGYAVTSCNHLLSNIEFLVGHRQATLDDWQKSATATPMLNILSDGPITGHRVARGTYQDADHRPKGDIVVWADARSRHFATIRVSIINNTPCKMHPDLTFYIGRGGAKMPIKTLSWGESDYLAPHEKRFYDPAEITNTSGPPTTFDGGAWFEDCQVSLGQ